MWCALHDSKLLTYEIDVEPPTQVAVEPSRAIDICDGPDNNLEPHVNLQRLRDLCRCFITHLAVIHTHSLEC